MEISKEEFKRYERVRVSGVTNYIKEIKATYNLGSRKNGGWYKKGKLIKDKRWRSL